MPVPAIILYSGHNIARSLNLGGTWESADLDPGLSNGFSLQTVRSTNGVFIGVIGQGERGLVARDISEDGLTWPVPSDPSTTTGLSPNSGVDQLCFFSGKYYGRYNSTSDYVSSFDGITWTPLTGVPAPTDYYSSLVTDGVVLFLSEAFLGNAAISFNGVTWTHLTGLPTQKTTYGGGEFQTIGTPGRLTAITSGNQFATSTNHGVSWTLRTPDPSEFGTSYSDYVATGHNLLQYGQLFNVGGHAVYLTSTYFSGGSWTQTSMIQAIGGAEFTPYNVSTSFLDPYTSFNLVRAGGNCIAGVTVNYLYVSIGGDTWNTIEIPSSVTSPDICIMDGASRYNLNGFWVDLIKNHQSNF